MVFRNIRSFIKNQPLIFALFTFLQITSILAVIFVYGQVRSERIQVLQYMGTVSTFQVIFHQPTAYDNIGNILRDIDGYDPVDTDHIILSFEENDRIFTYYQGASAHIDIGEKSNNNHTAVLHSYVLSDELQPEIGETIPALNRTFTLSGIRISPDAEEKIELPIAAVLPTDLVTKILIKLEQLPTIKTADEFFNFLNKSIPRADILRPEPRDYLSEYGVDAKLGICLATLLLVLLNISFLYQHILAERKNKFVILSICGFSAIRIAILLYVEIFIYFVIDLILSLLIWNLWLKPLLFSSTYHLFSGFDVMIPVSIYFLAITAVFVPKIMIYAKQSLLYLLHKETN